MNNFHFCVNKFFKATLWKLLSWLSLWLICTIVCFQCRKTVVALPPVGSLTHMHLLTNLTEHVHQTSELPVLHYIMFHKYHHIVASCLFQLTLSSVSLCLISLSFSLLSPKTPTYFSVLGLPWHSCCCWFYIRPFHLIVSFWLSSLKLRKQHVTCLKAECTVLLIGVSIYGNGSAGRDG